VASQILAARRDLMVGYLVELEGQEGYSPLYLIVACFMVEK
jgi:hypothetical protein